MRYGRSDVLVADEASQFEVHGGIRWGAWKRLGIRIHNGCERLLPQVSLANHGT
jgi:hypothetical protein